MRAAVCHAFNEPLRVEEVQLRGPAGMSSIPHSANLTLVTVFALHLMGAIENAGGYVELSIEPDSYYQWQGGIFEPALVARDGAVPIPDGPGWGVEIRPDWLEHAERRSSRCVTSH